MVYNGVLIGNVGRNYFEIGNYYQNISNYSGNLSLQMNDTNEGMFDNSGILTVKITIQKRK